MNYQNERLRKKINIDELAELAHISLSEDEKKQMEESEEDASEDNVTKENKDTLNEQSGIH